MGRVMEKAIRLGNELNQEKTWKEFARNHPEIQVFYSKNEEMVTDVDPFFPGVKIIYIDYKKGFVQSILYEYDGKIFRFPTE